ncbi:MAG TPA: adenosine kinase [Beijerinckiaceae bacterium]|nr:adenosine kinase [Beijerinckiaceae bacterium]HVB88715.1 adenosine kinase [Beijerinckiaceae bacterium]
MNDRRFDVLGIGNAIVDVVASAEDDLLIRQHLQKGGMTLVDEARADSLSSFMTDAVKISGGSAANTVVGVASLGGKAAFIGKVKDDAAGREFAGDIRASGVHFETPAALEGPSTARCLVFVTPDGERTMTTYLGACQNLGPRDVDRTLVEDSAILYLEGYLWDPPEAKAAFVQAAKIAHAAGNRVALSLSDPFCVDRYREEFLALLRDRHVDVLFANEHEIKSLYQTADLDAAVSASRDPDMLTIVTRSERGCIVATGGEKADFPAFPVQNLVDTTGAGDLFAAGFLTGLSLGANHETCARLAAFAASEAIQHFGARPQTNLRQLAHGAGVLA